MEEVFLSVVILRITLRLRGVEYLEGNGEEVVYLAAELHCTWGKFKANAVGVGWPVYG